jgi:RNA polymerase sigma factor (TIGR02999 family)
MDASQSHEITRLLRAWRGGDAAALDHLMPRVYDELHRTAHRYMQNERKGVTLQTTALVNEVYLKLADAEDLSWEDRTHFFAVSANIMRRILVDPARARVSAKRGGGAARLHLDDVPDVASTKRDREIVAIDEALAALEEMDPRKRKSSNYASLED